MWKQTATLPARRLSSKFERLPESPQIKLKIYQPTKMTAPARLPVIATNAPSMSSYGCNLP